MSERRMFITHSEGDQHLVVGEGETKDDFQLSGAWLSSSRVVEIRQ